MGRMGNFDALNFSPLTNANAECVTKIEIENVLIYFEKFCIIHQPPPTAHTANGRMKMNWATWRDDSI